MHLIFPTEFYDIQKNLEDKKEYEAYIAMLEGRGMSDFVWKEIQDYNLDNPNNIFNR